MLHKTAKYLLKMITISNILSSFSRPAIAFSGGVDSAVLAYLAVKTLGSDRTAAFTAVSESMPLGDQDRISLLAQEIGIPLQFVQTDELSLPEYRQNSPDRCYFCKRHILGRLVEAAQAAGFDAILEGSNADDLKDFRPGYRAVKELNVRSPLLEAGLTKEQVRQIATEAGLTVADRPSTPCLSSRIAYGVEITPERLRRIDQAERWLAERGVSPVRVRVHENELARIETSEQQIDRISQPEFRRELADFLKQLGFRWVALELSAFQSGSLNR